jgi:hypothetical protein
VTDRYRTPVKYRCWNWNNNNNYFYYYCSSSSSSSSCCCCCYVPLSQSFSSWYFCGTSWDPHRSGFKLHTAVLSVLCAMFQIWLCFVASLLNVFLVWPQNCSLNLSVIIPVAPIITGIIIHFRFHTRCIPLHKLLYSSFFLLLRDIALRWYCHVYQYASFLLLFCY